MDQITMEYCSKANMVADIFTKSLPQVKLERQKMMLVATSVTDKVSCHQQI